MVAEATQAFGSTIYKRGLLKNSSASPLNRGDAIRAPRFDVGAGGSRLRVRDGEVVLFAGIVLEVEQAVGSGVPLVQLPVVRGVFAVVAQQQLPVAVDAPEVLQRVVGIAGGHVVDGLHEPKTGLALLDRLLVEQVDTRQPGRRLEPGGGGDGGKEVDRVGESRPGVFGALRARPGDQDRGADAVLVGRPLGAQGEPAPERLVRGQSALVLRGAQPLSQM